MTDGGEPAAGAADPPIGADGAAQRGRRALNPLSVAGNLAYDRVLFFSDAVFAIAITLLVVDIRVPTVVANAAQELHGDLGRILSFAISFLVIGLFWMGHHRMFRYITALDRPIIFLNLLFLGTIAFLPYPTALLFAGNDQAAGRPGLLRLVRGRRGPAGAGGLALRHPYQGPGPGQRLPRAPAL